MTLLFLNQRRVTYNLGVNLGEMGLSIIGASLSKPHTSVTALQVACTYMYVQYLKPYTVNLN